MENNTSFIIELASPNLSFQSMSGMNAIRGDVLKSVLIVVLLAVTFVASLIPFALRRAAISQVASTRRRHIFAGLFSLLSCFGGGVFLATCLLDLLPDAMEKIELGLKAKHIEDNKFPLAEFLMAIGFFLVLFIEQIVLWFREKRGIRDDHHHHHDDDRNRLINDSADEGQSAVGRIDQRRHTAPSGPLGTIANVPVNRRQRHHSKRQVPPSATGAGADNRVVEAKNNEILVESTSQENEASGTHESHSAVNDAHQRDDGSGSVVNEAAEDIESIRQDVHFDPESHSTFRAIMLVMALSTHASFEGLALGLVADPAQALQIFTALSIHKFIIGFSLGLRLVQSRLRTLAIVGCSLLFCVSGLIGGFIGVAITDTVTSSADMLVGCLQGIACGTFLYITAFEILPHELNDNENRLCKLIMLLLGFTVICVFVYLDPE